MADKSEWDYSVQNALPHPPTHQHTYIQPGHNPKSCRYRGNRSDIDTCAHTFDGNRIGRERDAERMVTRKRVSAGGGGRRPSFVSPYPVTPPFSKRRTRNRAASFKDAKSPRGSSRPIVGLDP
ncbi:hypothetical protein WN51_03836 [Melipona quadrifasciata]|uniref:Uncharacterized protein n=1 Tax=Melipona quadrifasciata TaxID=166423 RepID=A0A0N0U7I5_9HYME|nr:hypothetical protein WN51_03836 [Melipona quadrifasciata]